MSWPRWAIAVCALSLVACGGDSGDDGDIRSLPRPTTGPYVSVAVDNHFHDVHVDEVPEIQADRSLVIKNQGSNLHNFTVVDTDVSRDIRAGKEISFDPVGDTFAPGTYDIICRYHGEQGMTGRFTIVD